MCLGNSSCGYICGMCTLAKERSGLSLGREKKKKNTKPKKVARFTSVFVVLDDDDDDIHTARNEREVQRQPYPAYSPFMTPLELDALQHVWRGEEHSVF